MELTQAEIEELEAALHALVPELKEAVVDTRAAAKPVDLDLPIGRVSRIDALARQQFAKEAARRKRDRLFAVKAALERLRTGDFGWCVRCDEPIGIKRLRLRPESAMCVRCG